MDRAMYVRLEYLLKKKARGVCASEGSIVEFELNLAVRVILEDMMKKKARGVCASEDSVVDLELVTAEYGMATAWSACRTWGGKHWRVSVFSRGLYERRRGRVNSREISGESLVVFEGFLGFGLVDFLVVFSVLPRPDGRRLDSRL